MACRYRGQSNLVSRIDWDSERIAHSNSVDCVVDAAKYLDGKVDTGIDLIIIIDVELNTCRLERLVCCILLALFRGGLGGLLVQVRKDNSLNARFSESKGSFFTKTSSAL